MNSMRGGGTCRILNIFSDENKDYHIVTLDGDASDFAFPNVFEIIQN